MSAPIPAGDGLARRAAERRQRRDPGGRQLLDLRPVEPGHAREVVDRVPVRVAERLEVADRAVVDRQRLGRRRVGDEALEPRADAPVVGAELVRAERRLLARAEQHVNRVRLAPLEPRELLVVEEQLEDVRRLRRARELRVERLVAPGAEIGRLLDAEQEVGEPAPAAIREDALEDDVDAVSHRLDRLGLRLVPAAQLELDLADVPELRAQRLRVGALVLVALALDQVRVLVRDVRAARARPRACASDSVVRCSQARNAVTSDGERWRRSASMCIVRRIVEGADRPYGRASGNLLGASRLRRRTTHRPTTRAPSNTGSRCIARSGASEKRRDLVHVVGHLVPPLAERPVGVHRVHPPLRRLRFTSSSGSNPFVSRINCTPFVEPDDEVRDVVVRLAVVEVRDREAEALVLHERHDTRVRVDVVRRRLLPLLRVRDDVVQVRPRRPRVPASPSRSRPPPSSPGPRPVSYRGISGASPCDVSGRIASTSRSTAQPAVRRRGRRRSDFASAGHHPLDRARTASRSRASAGTARAPAPRMIGRST